MNSRRWRSVLVAALLIAALAWLALRQPAPPVQDAQLVQREFMTMGTLALVSLPLDDRTSVAQAEAALKDLENFLAGFDRHWSMLDGELARLNRELALGKTILVPDDMQPLFAQAARATQASGGRFDVRVGALVKLWGFDDETHFHERPPPDADVRRETAALAQAPQLATSAYGPAPSVQLDFGAIAKGYAADLAIARLKAAGIANALVNLGGNLRVAGARGARPWRIGIRHPRPEGHSSILVSLEIHGDEAVLTSGDYERYFEFEGRRYHHILDPQTGAPAQGLESVTVVHSDGAWADAASTAIFVAGPAHWRETARAMGVDQVLVVDTQGRISATQKLAPRLRLAEGLTLTAVP